MQIPGRDPTRRNRNIGTARSGLGRSNRLVIPEPWNDPRIYWERLTDPIVIEREGRTFLVEPTAADSSHRVTIDDIVRVLRLLPPEDSGLVDHFVLRQPKRKERILSSVWGRLAYFATFLGPRGEEIEGPAIALEAQPNELVLRYSRSLDPDAAAELERLRDDGHAVEEEKRVWRVTTSPASIRATQLFRTLPHEFGHAVHYDRAVRRASEGEPGERLRLEDLYFRKPQKEREDAAHRYAREFAERHAPTGRIPFASEVDPRKLRQDGLDPRWFGCAENS